MSLKSSFVMALLMTAVGGPVFGQSAPDSQKITLTEKVRIPGASLKPGDYVFSVEDRLHDRAIVRITGKDQTKHFLVLTVPSAKLPQAGSDGLIRFTAANGKDEAVRGWACPGCNPSLEFVYPKAEAVKLTDQTTEPVLAVDPASDKLPANLSPDDMKVVTLWLLEPEHITASNKGKGVKAEKYAGAARPVTPTQTASTNGSEVAQTPAPADQAPVAAVTEPAANPTPGASTSTSELAQVPTPAPTPVTASTAPSPAVSAPAPVSQPTEMASAATSPAAASQMSGTGHSGHLPKTASSNYLYLFGGLMLMLAGFGVRLLRGSTAL